MIIKTNFSFLNKNYGYFESLPRNNQFEDEIGYGLVMFTVIGVILIIFCIISTVMCGVCPKKANRRTDIRLILSLFSISCGAVGLYLVLDPYVLRKSLPFFLVNTIEQCNNSTVVLEFLILQNYLISSTQIEAHWNKFKSTNRILRLALSYLLGAIFVECICVFSDNKNVLRLLYKTITIMLVLYTTGCFLCTAFQTCLYFDEIRSSRYSKKGSSTNYESDSAYSLKIRRKRPVKDTLNINKDHSNEAQNLLFDNQNRKHRSPLNSCSDVDYTLDDVQPVASGKGTVLNCKDSPGNKIQSNTSASDIFDPDSQVCSLFTNSDTKNMQSIRSKINVNRITNKDRLSQEVEVNVDFVESIAPKEGKHTKNTTAAITAVSEEKVNIDSRQGIEIIRQITFGNDILSVENGYLADGDTTSNHSFASSLSFSDNDTSDVWKLGVSTNNQQTEGTPKVTPRPHSLARVRHSYTLRKVVSIGYLISFSFLVDLVFQMYSIFGVYGVFGSKRTPEPWSWFVLQVSHRMTTITTCLLLLIAMYHILKGRNKRKRPYRLSIIDTKL